MAEATGSGTAMKELVEQFRAVTGATDSTAEHFLGACNGDLQMAIGMHMDSEGAVPAPAAGSGGPRASRRTQVKEPGPLAAATPEEVRAPIPQKHETLVEEQYTFADKDSSKRAKKEEKGPRTGRKRAGRSVFDGFRDFQAETRQQELALAGKAGTSVDAKRKTLEDLFRPPIDLLHKGTFLTAREEGTTTNRWMLINIQNVQEFACQVLNRDVWSHPAVKDLVQAHFVFWQVYSDSEEGKKYMQFYKIRQWPYVAVLDPRTGENLVTWNRVDSLTFCDLVTEFIAEHPSPDGSTPTKESQSPPFKKAKRTSIVDASEDSQLEAAIKASMSAPKQAPQAVPSSDQSSLGDDDLETFTDSEDESSRGATNKSPKKTVTFAPSQSENSQGGHLVAEVNGKADKTYCSLSQQSSMSSTSSQSQEGATSQGLSQESNNSAAAPTVDGTTQEEVDSGQKVPPEGSTISGNNLGSSSSNNSSGKTTVPGQWKEYLGDEKDAHSNLMIRFPDGRKTPLKIPSSSKLMALVQFVIEEGFSNERFELVTNYPRRKLSYMDFEQTLKEVGLFPQEAIFVQER